MDEQNQDWYKRKLALEGKYQNANNRFNQDYSHELIQNLKKAIELEKNTADAHRLLLGSFKPFSMCVRYAKFKLNR